IAAVLVSSTLTISQREDIATQMLLTTYSGSVTATGSTVAAAYASALAQAQALGANKEGVIDSSAVFRGSTLTPEQRQSRLENTTEFLRLGFSYEYASNLAAGRAFLEMTVRLSRDTFGTD